MTRTYLQTHSWINFVLDLKRADAEFWMLLGEAQSKAQHIAGVPLLPEVAERFLEVSLAKGVLATTAIEGNTLSEDEVRARILGQGTLSPSRDYLGREVDNILRAVNKIGSAALAGKLTDLTDDDIREYNRMVLSDLPLAEDVAPGRTRAYRVGVGHYRGAPPEDCDYLLARLCGWLNSDWLAHHGELADYPIAFGILKAVIAHLYLAWIHPFGDGNGRTARLMEFQILLQARVPSVAAHLLSNHYNNTRTEYYRLLDLSSKIPGGPILFIKYALRGFVDTLREQIDMVKAQQLLVHWQNHIHQVIRGSTASIERRRHLAIDLSLHHQTNISDVPTLTTRLAREYATKTSKTVRRDLNYLEEKKLITIRGHLVEPNRDVMLAFLPLVCPVPVSGRDSQRP